MEALNFAFESGLSNMLVMDFGMGYLLRCTTDAIDARFMIKQGISRHYKDRYLFFNVLSLLEGVAAGYNEKDFIGASTLNFGRQCIVFSLEHFLWATLYIV